MKHLFLLIKPASGICNMRCKYCFYYDVMDHRKIESYGFMSDNVLEKMVQRAYEDHHESVTFMFQGGEPTLVGLSFYEKLVGFVTQYNSNNIQTYYTIQTNGTLITPEFARFFKTYQFLVGISIDGNQRLHDMHRLDTKLQGSFSSVKKGLQLLQQHNVDFNILAVITEETTKHTKEVYRFLTNLGTMFVQFIPCLDSLEHQDASYTLTNEAYTRFLLDLFDVWERDFYNDRRISIRYFDDILKIILGYYPDTCTLMGHCTTHIVIEADGSTYPCDFYVLDELKTGSILESNFRDIVQSETAIGFIKDSVEHHLQCIECRYFKLCKGGCKRNNIVTVPGSPSKTKYCESVLAFFDKTYDRFIKIAQILQQEIRQNSQSQ